MRNSVKLTIEKAILVSNEITNFKHFFIFRMHELSEKLLNFITKDGKCSNLEKLLSNVEDAKELGNDSTKKYHGHRPFCRDSLSVNRPEVC